MATIAQPQLKLQPTAESLSRRLNLTGMFLVRYSLVLILLWFGLQKFTPEEAATIQPLIAHSPFMAWMYRLWSVQAVSNLIGIIEIATATLIAIRPLAPRASFAGSVGAIVTFLLTNSFLLSTPGTIDHSHVIPFLAGPGGFIIKDLPMLGGAIWTAGEALTARR